MIGIVDYGAGNLRSVELALAHLGAKSLTSSRPMDLAACERLLIPGDGHAGSTMEGLEKSGLAAFLKDFHQSGKWMMGICIGCQVILDATDEADSPCLGLLPGRCHRLSGGPGLKVPHMGWNQVKPQDYGAGISFLFKDIPASASFYFVHSYHASPARTADVLGLTDHGVDFASVIGHDNLVACQFHPEKSGPWGLKLLSNFLEVR